jgi:hypothetical protein
MTAPTKRSHYYSGKARLICLNEPGLPVDVQLMPKGDVIQSASPYATMYIGLHIAGQIIRANATRLKPYIEALKKGELVLLAPLPVKDNVPLKLFELDESGNLAGIPNPS